MIARRLITLSLVLALVVLIATLATSQQAPSQHATVGEWEWVTVVNTLPLAQGYSNGTHPVSAGDTCGIEPGGTVRLLGSDAEGVLLEYTAPGTPMGTPCPSGVRFLTSHAHFQGMTATYMAGQAAAQATKERVQRLLNQGQSARD
jgi:hypothetical protein